METWKASRARPGARATMMGPWTQEAMADLLWPSSSRPRTYSPPPPPPIYFFYWGSPQRLGGALEERALEGAWEERALERTCEEWALEGALEARTAQTPGGARAGRTPGILLKTNTKKGFLEILAN